MTMVIIGEDGNIPSQVDSVLKHTNFWLNLICDFLMFLPYYWFLISFLLCESVSSL